MLPFGPFLFIWIHILLELVARLAQPALTQILLAFHRHPVTQMLRLQGPSAFSVSTALQNLYDKCNQYHRSQTWKNILAAQQRQRNFFEALVEIFSNGSCSFEISLAENRGNWKLFDKYFCFFIKNIISSTRYYICTEVLQFLIFADIEYFHH